MILYGNHFFTFFLRLCFSVLYADLPIKELTCAVSTSQLTEFMSKFMDLGQGMYFSGTRPAWQV